MESHDLQVLENVLDDTPADAHTRRRLIQVAEGCAVEAEHRAIARFAQTALGERGAEPGAFYTFPGDPVANGVGLVNAGRKPV